MTISLFFAGNWSNRLQRFGYHDEARTDSNNLTDLDLSPIVIHNQPYGSPRTPQRTPQMTPEPMRRAKTDLSEADIKRHLPIFERNHNARIWLDKSSSLDALDQVGNESPKSPHHNRWRHYVNVAPPRPPKHHGNNPIKIEARRSHPVYVNVYSLGRRKPGDIVQTGRYCDCIVLSLVYSVLNRNIPLDVVDILILSQNF